MGVTTLANLFYQIFSVKANYWLSEWASIAENSNKTNDDDHLTTQYRYLSIYALFGLGQGRISSFSRRYAFITSF